MQIAMLLPAQQYITPSQYRRKTLSPKVYGVCPHSPAFWRAHGCGDQQSTVSIRVIDHKVYLAKEQMLCVIRVFNK